jgi:hypothetical protein
MLDVNLQVEVAVTVAAWEHETTRAAAIERGRQKLIDHGLATRDQLADPPTVWVSPREDDEDVGRWVNCLLQWPERG